MFKRPLFLFLLFGIDSAGAQVHLVRDARVEQPQVRLEHIFTGLTARGHVRLFATPGPGQKLTLSAEELEKIAQQHGVGWQAQDPSDCSTITGAFETVTADELLALLQPAVEKEMGAENCKITLEQRDIQIHLPAHNHGDLVLQEMILGRQRTVFAARFAYMVDGQPQKTYRVAGKVTPFVSVPVLRHAVKPGHIIQPSDLQWLDVPTAEVHAHTLTQESALLGAAPRQGVLRENTPLRRSDVYRPVTITKGEMVTLHAQTDCMSMTTRGKALEHGRTGEGIKILNVRSNRVVHATVAGPKLATVDILTIKDLR